MSLACCLHMGGRLFKELINFNCIVTALYISIPEILPSKFPKQEADLNIHRKELV
jgi:hypothetical protein